MAMGAIEMCKPNCDLPWCRDAPKYLASLSTKVWQVWLLPFRHQVVVGAIHPFGTNCLQPWPALLVNKSRAFRKESSLVVI